MHEVFPALHCATVEILLRSEEASSPQNSKTRDSTSKGPESMDRGEPRSKLPRILLQLCDPALSLSESTQGVVEILFRLLDRFDRMDDVYRCWDGGHIGGVHTCAVVVENKFECHR
jgi:hypothetical protein